MTTTLTVTVGIHSIVQRPSAILSTIHVDTLGTGRTWTARFPPVTFSNEITHTHTHTQRERERERERDRIAVKLSALD